MRRIRRGAATRRTASPFTDGLPSRGWLEWDSGLSHCSMIRRRGRARSSKMCSVGLLRIRGFRAVVPEPSDAGPIPQSGIAGFWRRLQDRRAPSCRGACHPPRRSGSSIMTHDSGAMLASIPNVVVSRVEAGSARCCPPVRSFACAHTFGNLLADVSRITHVSNQHSALKCTFLVGIAGRTRSTRVFVVVIGARDSDALMSPLGSRASTGRAASAR